MNKTIKKLSLGVILASSVSLAPLANADTADGASLMNKSWDQILETAKGGEVNWFLWGGADHINQYVTEYVGGVLKDQYDITLNRVPLTDTAAAVNTVLSEKESGVNDKGTVDMIWINGENFKTMKQGDMAWCGYLDKLPNNKLVNRDLDPKFGLIIQGDSPKQFLPKYTGIQNNLPSLMDSAAGIGSMSIGGESSVVRSLPTFEVVNGQIVPSLMLETLRVAIGASTYQIKSSNASGELAFGENTGINNIKLGNVIIPTNANGYLWLHSTFKENLNIVPAFDVIENKFDKDFFDHNQLREILIYIPSLNMYIVPNRYEYGVGEPPDDVLGNYAIYIDQNLDYYFSEIISEDNDFTKIKKNINVKFSNQIRSKRIKIEETREYHGYWSINNRNYIYFSNDEISPFLKDFFTVSGLEKKKIKKFNSNYNSIQDNYYNIPLIIHSSVETTDLIQENQKKIYSFEVGKLIGLQSNLFDEIKRVNDIEINFPNEYEYNIRIRIPRGFEIMDISALNMTSKYSAVSGEVIAYFHSKANIEGRFLLIEISEYYKSLYYDKSRYNDFSNIINTAANFYQKTINISKN